LIEPSMRATTTSPLRSGAGFGAGFGAAKAAAASTKASPIALAACLNG
jgi:hypothetical protein